MASTFRTIGVALDGSPFGEGALATAVALAKQAGASLRLIHVRTNEIPDRYIEQVPSIDWIEDDLRQQDNDYLIGLADRVTATGVNATPALLTGRPADALTEYAEESLDLLVMSTHGRGPVNRAWLGSVADRTARLCPVPLLLVHPSEGEALESVARPAFRQVLVPLDGSALAETILDSALACAPLSSAHCTLLEVVRPRTEVGAHIVHLTDEQQRTAILRAEEYLAGVREQLGARKTMVTTRAVLHPFPAQAIVETARELDADLIALATHGRGGISRLVIGSTADKVLRTTHTPVLLYRPRIQPISG
jgi:nucleotide-binding universal stress UspA family protein